MSPTEFSNYIKQRAIQQQIHHSHNGHNMPPNVNSTNGHLNSVSPARSLSPNPLSVAMMNAGSPNTNNLPARPLPTDSSYFFSPQSAGSATTGNGSNINSTIYSAPQQYGRNNLFDSNNLYGNGTASNVTATVVPNNSTIGTNSTFYSKGYGTIGNTSKYSPYIDTSNYYGLPNGQQPSNTMNSIGATSPHINGISNGHHQTLETNLNAGNINLLVAN